MSATSLLGELERLRMRHVERRREVHLRGLLGDGAHDLRPRVAGVDAPEAGDGVEHLAAFRRPVVHVLGLGQQARRGLELPARGERHPERVHVERAGARTGGDRRGRCGGVGVLVHSGSPSTGPLRDESGKTRSLEGSARHSPAGARFRIRKRSFRITAMNSCCIAAKFLMAGDRYAISWNVASQVIVASQVFHFATRPRKLGTFGQSDLTLTASPPLPPLSGELRCKARPASNRPLPSNTIGPPIRAGRASSERYSAADVVRLRGSVADRAHARPVAARKSSGTWSTPSPSSTPSARSPATRRCSRSRPG